MHVAIIPDGNRRWAKARGLSVKQGYEGGIEAVREIVKESVRLEVSYLTIFLLSTENVMRTSEWLGMFSGLIKDRIMPMSLEAIADGCQIRFVGNKDILGEDIGDLLRDIETRRPKEHKLNLNFCFGYSGRADIMNAVQKMIETKADPKDFHQYLATKDLPDPDILIRTSGEIRLSNFLLFETAYSELFFVEEHWPDFSPEKLRSIVAEFKSRDRRFGK